MKRIVLFIACLALMTFVGCEKDGFDNPFGDSKYSVKINGVSYKVSTMIGSAGGWSEEYGDGGFTLSILEEYNGGYAIMEYNFFFKSDVAPKKDDNFADMDLQVDNPYEYGYYSYQDGDATITKVNKSDEYIMVKFDNLTMVDSKGNTLTFHGSAPMPFRVY